jgi:hypothetical protein
MPGHFAKFVASNTTPGVVIIPQATPIGAAIDGLLLIWAASEAGERRDRLVWVPL